MNNQTIGNNCVQAPKIDGNSREFMNAVEVGDRIHKEKGIVGLAKPNGILFQSRVIRIEFIGFPFLGTERLS